MHSMLTEKEKILKYNNEIKSASISERAENAQEIRFNDTIAGRRIDDLYASFLFYETVRATFDVLKQKGTPYDEKRNFRLNALYEGFMYRFEHTRNSDYLTGSTERETVAKTIEDTFNQNPALKAAWEKAYGADYEDIHAWVNDIEQKGYARFHASVPVGNVVTTDTLKTMEARVFVPYDKALWGSTARVTSDELISYNIPLIEKTFETMEKIRLANKATMHNVSMREAFGNRVWSNSIAKYFTEYLFKTAVDNANAAIEAAHPGMKDEDIPFILTSEARTIHRVFDEKLNGENGIIRKNWDVVRNMSENEFREFLTEQCIQITREELIDRGHSEATDVLLFSEENYNNFIRSIGTDQMLPLSPYDNRIKNSAIAMRNGEKTLFVRKEDVGAMQAGERTTLYEATAEDSRFKQAGIINTYADRLNLSAVLKYMNAGSGMDEDGEFVRGNSDFDRIVQSFENSGKAEAFLTANIITDEMITKMDNILQFLTDNGYEYRIRAGHEAGQIEAEIAGTKMSVRLIDVSDKQYVEGRYNWNMIGRVYDSKGQAVIYNSILGKKEEPLYENVPGMELRPLSYILGKPVLDRTGAEMDLRSKNVDGSNTVYRNGNKADMTYVLEKSGKKQYILKVGSVASNKLLDPVVYSSDPKVNIELSVESARNNFKKLADIDGLIEQFHNHGTDVNYVPVYAADDIVAGIQSQYWEYLKGESKLLDPAKLAVYDALTSSDVIIDPEKKEKETAACFLEKTENLEADIKKHFEMVLDAKIGFYQKDNPYLQKINALNVVNYMTSQENRYQKEDLFSDWIGKAGLTKDNFIQSYDVDDEYGQYKLIDRSIQYDPSSAATITSRIAELRNNPENEHAVKTAVFYENVLNAVAESLETSGIVLPEGKDSIRIDDNGVIRYDGFSITKQNLTYMPRMSSEIRQPRRFDTTEQFIAAYRAADEKEKAILKNACFGKPVTGYIGQIVAPDAYGVVTTKFKSGVDYSIIPGYEAHFEHVDPEHPKPDMDRLVCIGYEKSLLDSIRKQIREDVIFANGNDNVNSDMLEIGKAHSVNNVFRKMVGVRLKGHGADYRQAYQAMGWSDEAIDSYLKSQGGRIRMTSEYVEGASVNVYFTNMSEAAYTGRMNDNFDTPFNRAGRRNMNAIEENRLGYVDPTQTGNTKNTGMVMILAEGASVDPNTGHINPARNADGTVNKDAHSWSWNNDPTFKYSEYDSAERVGMAKTNHEHELKYVENIGFAQISLGGWNMEDGVVISKNFAESILVPDESNPPEMRHLKKGDKLSDSHGNKGVIALIVDRDMDMKQAEKEGLADAVKVFKDNPHLDYVTSPYSAVSRTNGGTYVEANDNGAEPLIINGEVRADGIGHIMVHVLEQTVDHKTKVEGATRKFSSQAIWALAEQKAYGVLASLYKGNERSFNDLQSYMNLLGASITDEGKLNSASALTGVEKNVFELPTMEQWKQYGKLEENIRKDLKSDKAKLEWTEREKFKAVASNFEKAISDKGGYMVLPFPVVFANGQKTPEIHDSAKTEPWIADHFDLNNSEKKYLLPIMSAKLRSDTELFDGKMQVHDYTKFYESIFEQAFRHQYYAYASKNYETGGNIDGTPIRYADVKVLESKSRECQKKAQEAYDELVDKVTAHDGPLDMKNKHNFFKEKVMGKTIRAATMVMGADPRLDIGEVAISRKNAEELGLLDENTGRLKKFLNATTGRKEDVGLLIYRDPVLRDGAMRYVSVRLDDSVEGMTINPVAYKSQDGDFDGDTEVAVPLTSWQAMTEASDKLSFKANMIDKSQKPMRIISVTDNNGNILKNKDGVELKCAVRPLYFNSGLDLAAGEAANPELIRKREELENRINMQEYKFKRFDAWVAKNPEATPEQFRKAGVPGNSPASYAIIKDMQRDMAMKDYSEYVHEALNAGFALHSISFGDTEAHANSILKTVMDGAKGNVKKLARYLEKSLGLHVETGTDEQGRKTLKKVEKVDHPYKEEHRSGFSVADKAEALVATCAKTFYAGMVGGQAQKAFGAMAANDAEAALEPVYALQQRLMQAKHSAVEAISIIHNVRNVFPTIMQGYMIEKVDGNGEVIPLTEANNTPGKWRKKVTYQSVYINRSLPVKDRNRKVTIGDLNRMYQRSLANGINTSFDEFVYSSGYVKSNEIKAVSSPMYTESWTKLMKVFVADPDGLNNPDLDPVLIERAGVALSKVAGQVSVKVYGTTQIINKDESLSPITKLVYGKKSITDMLFRHAKLGKEEERVMELFGTSETSFMKPDVFKANAEAKRVNELEKIKHVVAKDELKDRAVYRKASYSVKEKENLQANTGMALH